MRSLDRIFRRNKPNLKTLAQWVKGLFTTGVNGAWYDPSDINLTWRRNLLTYTEQFDNAAWTKTGASVSADAATAPDGTASADKLVEDNSTGVHRAYQTPTVVASTAYTYSVFVKAAGRTQVRLLETTLLGAIFDVVNGVVSSVDVGITAAINSAGNGWYKCSITSTTGGAQTFYANQIQIVSSGNNSYTGDGTSGIYIWGAQLEVGSTATPYQRITDGIKDYLDYNPLPILYQDAAGTTPVTAVGQPVGLMLDKSKGLVLGPELVTNGDFSNGTTRWVATSTTQSAASGALVVTATSNAAPGSQQTITTVIGKTYKISGLVIAGGSNSVANSARLNVSGVSGAQAVVVGNGVQQTLNFVFTATSTSHLLQLQVGNSAAYGNAGDTATFDNISVRELPGNHAFNPSGNSANFPVLSARYNLLTKTEDFNSSTWSYSKTGTGVTPVVTPNFTTAPNGSTTAVRIQLDVGLGVTGGDISYITQPATNSATSILRCFFKLNSGTSKVITFRCGSTLQQITVTDQWKEFSVGDSIGNRADIMLYGNVGGGGSVDLLAWHPDLRVANDGVNLPAYQRVNTATDYDTVGFKPYLAFNGTNQWLQTNNIDFTYGDKMFVSAGVRKLSDVATGVLAELSASILSNNGSFYALAPAVNGLPNFGWASKGSSAVGLSSPNNFAAPITNVLSGIGDISGDQAILRINGDQAASSASDQGTGNYGNYPLYIGARAGASYWFNGRLYGLVVAGKSASASEIASTEAWLNQKTGAYEGTPNSMSLDLNFTNNTYYSRVI